MYLSKSRYTKGVQCPKMLWMDAHKPELFDESVMNDAILSTGNAVGDLAMGYYGDFVEVAFDSSDFDGMVARTRELLDAGTPVICEATFSHDGNLCMVDILRVEGEGVHLVEVKSSTHKKEIHLHDMAYQSWLLGRCGLNVLSASLMHLNGKYVRHGDLDVQELFTVVDCSEEVFELVKGVGERVAALKATADCDDEPVASIGQHCTSPYECGYCAWCWRDVPKPSVFDVQGIQMSKALSWYDRGIRTLQDLYESGESLTERRSVQVRAEVEGLDTIVDQPRIKEFLDGLSFPLYFLDFESFMPAVPLFDGTKPFQQIPSQYSLHVLAGPDAKLEHREFLAEAGGDPRRSVAEHLVADIPADVCVLAYYKNYECSRLRELAAAYPDLGEHLRSIADNVQDLYVPFQKAWYYHRAMGGSNSIKYVLPALFPNDPELDYHTLDGVHNGSQAAAAFENLGTLDEQERERVRTSLLKYCELDTLAMVKIWQRLTEAASCEERS